MLAAGLRIVMNYGIHWTELKKNLYINLCYFIVCFFLLDDLSGRVLLQGNIKVSRRDTLI